MAGGDEAALTCARGNDDGGELDRSGDDEEEIEAPPDEVATEGDEGAGEELVQHGGCQEDRWDRRDDRGDADAGEERHGE